MTADAVSPGGKLSGMAPSLLSIFLEKVLRGILQFRGSRFFSQGVDSFLQGIVLREGLFIGKICQRGEARRLEFIAFTVIEHDVARIFLHFLRRQRVKR